MTLDERLGDLLTDAATRALPATESGVQTAIGRRKRRRHRQRLAVSGIAGVCVIAGIAGGIALLPGDPEERGVADIVPAMTVYGIDQPGFELTGTNLHDLDSGDEQPLRFVSFSDPDHPIDGPLMVATTFEVPDEGDQVIEEGPSDDPIDLDGNGRTDDPTDGVISRGPDNDGVGIRWALANGDSAAVGGYDVDEEDIVAYVRSLERDPFDLATLPAPAGLQGSDVVTMPLSGAQQATADYRSPTGPFSVSTTNQPGFFDIMRTSILPYTGDVEAIELDDDVLGHVDGLISVRDAGAGSSFAYLRTASGLTVDINADGIEDDALRALLADDPFVVLPTPDTTTPDDGRATDSGGPTTTVVATATTVITTDWPSTQAVEITPGRERVSIYVPNVTDHIANVATATADVEPTTACADGVAAYDALYQQEGVIPDAFGWLEVTMDTDLGIAPGPTADGAGTRFVVCEPAADGTTVLAIELFVEPPDEVSILPLPGVPGLTTLDITG